MRHGKKPEKIYSKERLGVGCLVGAVGGVNAVLSQALAPETKPGSGLKFMVKDAGMQMSTVYFYGIEANKQLIALAKQVDALSSELKPVIQKKPTWQPAK